MKCIELTVSVGTRVCIPLDKITGFCEYREPPFKTFICTGPAGDSEENGWYVMETIEQIKDKLDEMQ